MRWRRRSLPIPGLLCGVLLAMFVALGARSAWTHSATADEPVHIVSSYRAAFAKDYRMDFENPPLWKYWAMLPHREGALLPHVDEAGKDPAADGYIVATQEMSQTPWNDGVAILKRSRVMMLILGAALALATAAWSWRLAGPSAGVLAMLLFSLDPNFLAHAPLVKNDIAFCLLFFMTAWATWEVGEQINGWTLPLLLPLVGMALATKMSGPVAGVVMVVLLLIRALLPEYWAIGMREVRSIGPRLGVAAGVGLLSLVCAVLVIWASYRFRYAASPGDGGGLNVEMRAREVQRAKFFAREGRFPEEADVSAEPTPPLVKAVLAMDSMHLLPQAWLAAVLQIQAAILTRPAYLMGAVSTTGWWYYFPVAMLAKTPLPTITAALLAIVAAVQLRRRGYLLGLDRWALACVAVPPVIYMIVVTTSSFNLGIRHVLAVYPFVYMLIAIVAARALAAFPRVTRPVVALLTIGLMAEVLLATPHFLSFFNVIARPHRLWLLSDSNLDWGQDLPYVATWQREHPDQRLYLAYWGPTDPRSYRIEYTNLPGGFALGHEQPALDMSQPGAVIVSATILQGVNVSPDIQQFYAPLAARKPDEIIGDTLYLYRWTPPTSR